MYKIILRLRATLWEECLRIATLHSCICGLAEKEKSSLVFVFIQVQSTCTRKLSRNLRNFIFLQTFTSTECVFINLQAYTSCVGVWIHYQHWSEYLLVSGMPCKWDASTNLNTGLVCLTSIFEVGWVVPIDLQVWLQRHKINNVKNPKDARRVTTWSPHRPFRRRTASSSLPCEHCRASHRCSASQSLQLLPRRQSSPTPAPRRWRRGTNSFWEIKTKYNHFV